MIYGSIANTRKICHLQCQPTNKEDIYSKKKKFNSCSNYPKGLGGDSKLQQTIIKLVKKKMCLQKFFTILSLFKKKKIIYEEISTICDESEEFNILKCSYICANKIARKNDITEVKIGKDRIIFANDEFFKFDYMLQFLCRKDNILTIVALGIIDSTSKIIKADAKCIINLTFTSGKNVTKFLEDLRKHILIYKRYDTYDKSVMKFKNFTRQS